jgi:peroxiredoxin Q/BCP
LFEVAGVPLNPLRTTGALISAVGTSVVSLLGTMRNAARVTLAPGDVAPDFDLTASDGRTYRLGDYKGTSAVVVAWFPKAFTGGCTAECASIGMTTRALAAFDAQVFAASCDTVRINREFADSVQIACPVLSDTDKRAARAYGVLGPLGLPRRWTFYIGVDGRILEVDRQVRTASHGADIVTSLERLRVSRRP